MLGPGDTVCAANLGRVDEPKPHDAVYDLVYETLGLYLLGEGLKSLAFINDISSLGAVPTLNLGEVFFITSMSGS